MLVAGTSPTFWKTDMGRVKDLLMDVEEKVWDALQAGASDEDDIMGYVLLFYPEVTLETIRDAIRTVYAAMTKV